MSNPNKEQNLHIKSIIVRLGFLCFAGSSKPWKKIAISTGIELCCWLLTMAWLFLVAKLLETTNSGMSWYGHHGFILVLYMIPLITGGVALQMLFLFHKKGKISPSELAISLMAGSQLLWTIILIFGTCLRIRTVLCVLVVVLPSAVASGIATFSKQFFTPKMYIILNFALTILPILFIVNQGVTLFTVLIPMAGRMGPTRHPELLMALISGVFGIISSSLLVPIVLTLKKRRSFFIGLTGFHFFVILIVILTPFGFPYAWSPSFPAVQRFQVLHVERTFHDSKGNVVKIDSGFYVEPQDINGINYVQKVMDELETAQKDFPCCESLTECSAPGFNLSTGYWVDAAPPVVHHPTNLVLTSQSPVDIRTRKMSFAVTGPDHMFIYIAPRDGVVLKKWSFDDGEPKVYKKVEDRDTYVISYNHGVSGGALEFNLQLMVDPSNTPVDEVLDITVVGRYFHIKDSWANEFRKFVAAFPNWAEVIPCVHIYKSWAF